MAARDDTFEEHRPVLLGMAYRLLGSMWDAEDVVQDAYVRWTGADRGSVRDPRSFLLTIVSRLALDQLKSARVTRESYRGPWLPEPVATGMLGPLETAELRDTVRYATVHLLQRLSPPERAVFVLREAFELPYDDIARAVGAPVATCRQIHRRARLRVAGGRDRFPPAPREHARLLVQFLQAARSGDLRALTEMLSEDVVAWNDGGGKVRAALRPVVGRRNVLAFVAGLVTRYDLPEAEVVAVNGEAALWLTMGGLRQIMTADVLDGRITELFAVLNPDKLAHVRGDSAMPFNQP